MNEQDDFTSLFDDLIDEDDDKTSSKYESLFGKYEYTCPSPLSSGENREVYNTIEQDNVIHEHSIKSKFDFSDYCLSLIFILIFAGLIFWLVNIGIKTVSNLLFLCLALPTFFVMYFIVLPNLYLFIFASFFLLGFIPAYTPDFMHIRSMSVCFGCVLFIVVSIYFHDLGSHQYIFQERLPLNPLYAYAKIRTEVIRECKFFFDDLFAQQRVSPGTFYNGILYKQLPLYQKALNDIMNEVLKDNYFVIQQLESLSLQQKEMIISRAKAISNLGLEGEYLLTILHQHFLYHKYKRFSNWVEIAVIKYPYEGIDAWQNVLSVYSSVDLETE